MFRISRIFQNVPECSRKKKEHLNLLKDLSSYKIFHNNKQQALMQRQKQNTRYRET